MPVKKATSESFGYAFISFKTEDDAKRALTATNGKDFNGKKLSVDYAFVRVEKQNDQQANKKQKTENGSAVAKTTNGAVAKTQDAKPDDAKKAPEADAKPKVDVS